MKATAGMGRHGKYSFAVRDRWNRLVYAAGNYDTLEQAQIAGEAAAVEAMEIAKRLGLAHRNTDRARNAIRAEMP